MPKIVEMDQAVSLSDQLRCDEGPVVLINTFVVPPEEVDEMLATWATDASIMKAQPGFISAQVHRGIGGSGVILNYAVWQSVAHFRAAFTSPEFRTGLADYSDNVTISPHLFRKIEVSGICVA